jgi:post-segregation antitoxin (ccd killing protein)
MPKTMKNHAQARGGKRMQRLTVSLPENLVKRVRHVSRESGLKISRIVATALEQQLGEQTPRPAEPPVYPTVLWKLKGRGHLRGPSPTLRTKRVGSWRLVELDRLSV